MIIEKVARNGAWIIFVSVMPGHADASVADRCIQAAQRAAANANVPADVLIAITLTETGRDLNGALQPWPWAINKQGEGTWFDTAPQALAFAHQAAEAGHSNFDVGCFQLNYRWHGENFASLEDMFDPDINAGYAAQFLSRLYAESGDWSVAAGTYHSRTSVNATRYRARFDAIRATVGDAPALLASAEPPALRINTFPLLSGSSTHSAFGSLVPLAGSE